MPFLEGSAFFVNSGKIGTWERSGHPAMLIGTPIPRKGVIGCLHVNTSKMDHLKLQMNYAF
jgi:hypothetical protein